MSTAAASLAALVAEKARRERVRAEEAARKEAEEAKKAGAGVEAKAQILALCTKLRAHYHPKQAAFFDRTKTLRAVLWRGAALCTRRAGKTAGGTREVFARCLEQGGYRAIYCGQTREEAKARAWESDTRDGWLDLLEDHGEPIPKSKTVAYYICGLEAYVNRQTLTVDFSNGSQIVIFAANHKKDQRKLRGRAKHLVWVDEAQEFLELTNFVESVCSALVKDYKGEMWLTGTPSEDASGYFYEVTCEPESGDEPRPGWDVHRWAVTDNPFFGRVQIRELDDGAFDVIDSLGQIASTHEDRAEAEQAAEQLRWDSTAGATLIENGWKGEEPAFLREYKGKWCKLDAFYVYAVHAVPETSLYWTTSSGIIAPIRETADGWLDYEAAMADLPRRPNGGAYRWLTGIGVDFGMNPHPMAISAWNFCLDLKGIWELWSWKKTGLVPDDQRDCIWRIVRQVEHLMVLVGDPGGQKIGDLIAWKERTGLPIEPADKDKKATWQEMLNGDIRTGLCHFRKGSPMLHEMKHLIKRRGPTGKFVEHDNRRLPDGTIPGNDCSDGGLYASRHIHHFLAKEPPPPPQDAMMATLKRDEQLYERLAEEQSRAALKQQAWEADPWATEGWEL